MSVSLGVECFLSAIPDGMRGQRIGLVSNYTVVDEVLRPTIDRFLEHPDLSLTTLLGPEHGVMNSAREGEHVHFATDAHTGLPAYSLYGETRQPTPEMLADVDVLVVDLQDIGSRYYTNMNTMALTMEAADEAGKPVVVLDRPNPLGGLAVEGNILEPEFQSFVGGGTMPNRHGLTIGELALWFQAVQGIGHRLSVVPMRGWHRNMLWDETGLAFVSPSPNTTHLDMALLYPGTCLFEGTNVSLGRGTPHPFEVVGAPYLDGHRLADAFNQRDLPGVRARPTYFVPNYSQFQGELCQGIQLHVRDRRRIEPVRTGIELLIAIKRLAPDQFEIVSGQSGKPSFFQLLAGTENLEHWIHQDPNHAADLYVDRTTTAWQNFQVSAEAVRLY